MAGRQVPVVRGFTIIEVAAAVAVAGLLLCVLFIAGDRSRRLGRLGEDVAHLRETGAMTGAYASDNGDRLWGFSWRAGHVYQTQYPDLNSATFDVEAAANQLVYLIRTRGGRPTTPVITSFFPHVFYSHLVLADYSGQRFPWTNMISAADTYRLKWANDPDCFLAGCFGQYQPDPSDPKSVRWIYSGSFSAVVATFDQSPVGSRIEPGGYTNVHMTPMSGVLIPQLMTALAYPSQKVLVHDQNARHFGPRQAYCTHNEAKLPLLMGDASVAVRAAAESNNGWYPNNPGALSYPGFYYDPTGRPWEPPALNPVGDWVNGRFRWTRNGLAGRDFGGPEIR